MLEEDNVNLTMEEIMCLTDEDLKDMGTTREELIDIIQNINEDDVPYGNCDQEDGGSSNYSSEIDDEAFSSDQEIEIEVDDSALETLDMEQEVEIRIEDLPFLNVTYLENMMNWSWDEHLNPKNLDKNETTIMAQPIVLPTGLSKKNRLKREKKLLSNPQLRKDGPIPKTFHYPTSFWENFENIIHGRFKHCNPVTDIKCIVNETLLQRFKKAITDEENRLQKPVSNRIVLCFHGTRATNIPEIIQKGLLVPGKDNNLSVVNGSALGVGIYVTVLDPSISVGYCFGGNQLFACAVLLSDTVNTKNHGNVLVIKEERYILPCFLVTVRVANHYLSTYAKHSLAEEEKKQSNVTKKGELVFSKKRKEEQREKIRKKKIEKLKF